jgi:hypothetical protein
MPNLRMHGATTPLTDMYSKDNYNWFNLDIMHCLGILDRTSLCQYSFGILHAEVRLYRDAGKSLARPGRKQATATEDIDVHVPIHNHNWRNISTIYIYNKTSIKRNILTIKQNTSGSRSG